ncbi:MAG: CAP domain-containing protein [Neobacillus sp.]
MSKAILTLAASTALFGANPGQNNAHAANLNPTLQKKVYVTQDSNINEINSMIENYLRKIGMDKNFTQVPVSHNKVKQPVQAVAPKPVQQPVKVSQPQTTQTAGTLSAYEQKVVDLTNQERAKNGLPALKVDLTLSKMAHEKSRDMSVNHYFSHTSPTYGTPFDMMKKFGITYSYAGENIAMGQQTPEEVVNAWMNSEGHRRNILDPNFTYIGVGYVSQGNYWTQDFIGK